MHLRVKAAPWGRKRKDFGWVGGGGGGTTSPPFIVPPSREKREGGGPRGARERAANGPRTAVGFRGTPVPPCPRELQFPLPWSVRPAVGKAAALHLATATKHSGDSPPPPPFPLRAAPMERIYIYLVACITNQKSGGSPHPPHCENAGARSEGGRDACLRS